MAEQLVEGNRVEPFLAVVDRVALPEGPDEVALATEELDANRP